MGDQSFLGELAGSAEPRRVSVHANDTILVQLEREI